MVNTGASIHPLVYEQLLHANLRDIVKKSCFDGVNFLHAGDIIGNFLVQVRMIGSFILLLLMAVYVDHFRD